MKAIVGLSGGIDSCWALKTAMEDPNIAVVGTVTFINGWETCASVENIEAANDYYGLPSLEVAIPEAEYHAIQKAFLLASTPDAECPTDLAIKAFLLQSTEDFGADKIITGGNRQTEGTMPPEWSMIDYTYLKNVCKRFGVGIRDFPRFNAWDAIRYKQKVYRILEGIDYNPDQAKQELQSMFGWKDYAGKHEENIYTRFVKSLRYYKFGIDVRAVELIAKVDAGLMSVDEMIDQRAWPESVRYQFDADWKLVEKRLGVQRDNIMSLPVKSYRDYGIGLVRRARLWLKQL